MAAETGWTASNSRPELRIAINASVSGPMASIERDSSAASESGSSRRGNRHGSGDIAAARGVDKVTGESFDRPLR